MFTLIGQVSLILYLHKDQQLSATCIQFLTSDFGLQTALVFSRPPAKIFITHVRSWWPASSVLLERNLARV